MSPRTMLCAALLSLIAVVLLAAGCGSEGADPVAGADDPIPVEPDGGIGDGAEPPPFADDEPAPEGDWHGADVATTNCPGTTWRRVQASTFSFSLPEGVVDTKAQGIDSEIGIFAGEGIEVNFDYGWYSQPLDQEPNPRELTLIDYDGLQGFFVVAPAETSSAGENLVGVYFPEVLLDEGPQWNKLTLYVLHDSPDDEIIARCIANSVSFG